MYISYIFFFNDTATTEIYTLSLHDALPIFAGEAALDEVLLRRDPDGVRVLHEHRRDRRSPAQGLGVARQHAADLGLVEPAQDRKSTRLNSSHANISYAVFCLKKKKKRYLYH